MVLLAVPDHLEQVLAQLLQTLQQQAAEPQHMRGALEAASLAPPDMTTAESLYSSSTAGEAAAGEAATVAAATEAAKARAAVGAAAMGAPAGIIGAAGEKATGEEAAGAAAGDAMVAGLPDNPLICRRSM